eukprot:TRINITY_DN110941_c0_g1_i1.p1 TRINITY_DN110941_c0_g1~~TRINITY_DN110941_c0_g1_i1.p1  ORF type:complete len:459 (+),score=86.74 TRINITY_DN110941_c0_g1_i1:100-1476(+)
MPDAGTLDEGVAATQHVSEAGPCPFSSPPVEVLFSIFGQLLASCAERSTDVTSACRCIAVCRAWRAVARLPCLWASLRLSGYSTGGSDEVGRRMKNNAHALAALAAFVDGTQDLEFFFSSWTEPLLAAALTVALRASGSLRALRLKSIRFMQLPTEAAALGDGLSGLQEFCLQRSRCESMEELPLLEELFSKWKKLDKLNLRFVPLTARSLQLLPGLLELTLTAGTWHCLPEAIVAIGSCKQLRSFCFTAAPRVSGFVHAYDSALIHVLQNCAKIEALALAKLSTSYELLEQLGTCVEARNLRALRLSSCRWRRIPPKVLGQFGAGLQELDLSSCVLFGDDELQTLCAATPTEARSCLKCLALRSVLHGDEVSDQALLMVARTFDQLERLCVTGGSSGERTQRGGITAFFLEELVDCGLLPSLQELNVRGFYGLSKESSARLQKLRPHLVVRWAELKL